jgi:outer membrane immunogenic protein
VKRFLLASTAVVALSAPSFGADLAARFPVKAPVIAAPPYSWTGCYVGGHAGVGWGRKEYFDNTFGDIGGPISFNVGADFVGGGQVGCDYQFASNWVVGIAGDFSWANIEGQTNDPFFNGKFGNPLPLSAKTNFLGSVTGRVGYAWDHYLLYVKGGAAWAHDKYAVTNLAFFNGFICGFVACDVTGSETRSG